MAEIINEKTRLFIKRERLRKELFRTRNGETICLNYEQVELLLKWIKELEERAGVHGIEKR